MPVDEIHDGLETSLLATQENPAGPGHVDDILDRFTARHGLPAMRFGGDGILTLTLGDALDVVLVHASGSGTLIMSAEMPEGAADDPATARQALIANANVAVSGGGTFGKVPGSGALQFSRMTPLTSDTDDTAFEADLMNFAEIAADWYDHFALALDVDDAPAGQAQG